MSANQGNPTRDDEVCGGLVRLRPVREEDLPQIVAWENDPETTRFSGGPLGTTVEGERRRLLAHPDGGEPTAWAIETRDDGRLIGVIGLHSLHRRHHRARVFAIIGSIADRGKGFGTDALRCLLHHAFTRGGWHRLSMRVLPENQAILRSAEKCGFEREGVSREAWFVDGRFHDDIRLAILEPDWRGPLSNGGGE
jgi:RimJ/RimL family protein N-acetyltransferase